MENVEPFDCCPTIGRHVSYTRLVKPNRVVEQKFGSRTKSVKPIDKVFSKLKLIQPLSQISFKAESQGKKPRDISKATVSAVSVKPYKRWFEEWEPGDSLPLVPPGFRMSLCANMDKGRMVNRRAKDEQRFRPMNESELSFSEQMGQKSLGPKIKDSVYSLLSMVAKARGLWVDEKNKLRCPPGTPNANQFTDITGSNCLIPVKIKPKGAVSSGARLARREVSASLTAAMDPGARDYKSGIGGPGLVGNKENFDRGRDIMDSSERMRKDFKNGLFKLPSGQAITGFKQNAEGKRNFLLAVSELMPSVDPGQAAQFWDSMLGENVPLTTLQKVQMEDYLDGFFQSFFYEARSNPLSTSRLITDLEILPFNSSAAWNVDLRSAATSTDKKGNIVQNPNDPISEAGFKVTLNFNPIAAYYIAKSTNPKFTGHGTQSTMRSQGAFTGTHEYGHLAHFANGLTNLGFNPGTLQKNKNGAWNIDLRNISNPNNSPTIARLIAQVQRIEAFQSGNKYQTLASGQRVRMTVADQKEAVAEFYGDFYNEFKNDLGGTIEDFELLKSFAGSEYSHQEYLETRAEAYAVMRHHGPQAVIEFAEQQAIYQKENPAVFPNPDSAAEIATQVYDAMNRIFYGTGYSRSPEEFHERNDEFGRSSLSSAITPTNAPKPLLPNPVAVRTARLSRFMPKNRPGSSSRNSGTLTGPMTSRQQVGRDGKIQSLTGAISDQTRKIYNQRPQNSSFMPVAVNGQKSSQKLDSNIADLISSAKIIDGSIDLDDIIKEGGVLIESDGVLDNLAETAGVVLSKSSETNTKYSKSNKKANKIYDKELQDSVESFQRRRIAVTSHIQAIRDVQNRLQKNRNATNNLDEIDRVSYPEMTLDETLKILIARDQSFMREIDLTKRDIALKKSNPDAFALLQKQRVQNEILTSLASIKKSTDKIPELLGSMVDFKIVENRDERNSASIDLIDGKLVPQINIKIHPRDNELFDHPNYGVANSESLSSFSRSSKFSRASSTYHQMGHVFNDVSQLESFGIKTGVGSDPILDQLKSGGPELGDSVVGSLFALATGKKLSSEIDDLDEPDVSLMADFMIDSIAAGAPRDNTSELSRIRNLIFSGVTADTSNNTGNLKSYKYSRDGLNTSRTTSTFDRFGSDIKINGKDYSEAKTISKQINEIINDAVGYEFNNGALGSPANIFSKNGLGGEISQYAKTSQSEKIAESFTLAMLNSDLGFDLSGQEGLKARQLSGAVDKIINNRATRDNILVFTPEQKQEFSDLYDRLVKTVSDQIDFETNFKTVSDQINFERYLTSERIVTDIFKPVELPKDSLSGAISSNQEEAAATFIDFETSMGSKYIYGANGKVSRTKPITGSTIKNSETQSSFENTKFLTPENQLAVRLAFERGDGVGDDGTLNGRVYDDSNLNRQSFLKLRKDKESFDRAYVLSGGKIVKTKPESQFDPAIGLYPFEWNTSGEFHSGNEIVGVTSRESRANSLTGAMTTSSREWPLYRNFYSILEITNNASIQEIKKSYIAKARKMHPDVDKSDGATERFQALQKAFETLSDPDNKAKYDTWMINNSSLPNSGPSTTSRSRPGTANPPPGPRPRTANPPPGPRPRQSQNPPDEVFGVDWPSAPFDDSTVFPRRALSPNEFDEMYDYQRYKIQPNRVGRPPGREGGEDDSKKASTNYGYKLFSAEEIRKYNDEVFSGGSQFPMSKRTLNETFGLNWRDHNGVVDKFITPDGLPRKNLSWYSRLSEKNREIVRKLLAMEAQTVEKQSPWSDGPKGPPGDDPDGDSQPGYGFNPTPRPGPLPPEKFRIYGNVPPFLERNDEEF